MRSSALLLVCVLVALALCAVAARRSDLVDGSNAADVFTEHNVNVELQRELSDAEENEALNRWRESNKLSPDGGIFGLDVSIPVNVTQFECLVSKSFDFAVVRMWRSLCEVDANGAATVEAAWKAGMKQVDIYLYPARSCILTPEEQVTAALAAIDNSLFGTLWLDIETAAANWTTPAENTEWIQRAATQALTMLGQNRVGVYTSLNSWSIVTANATEAPFGSLPLWYPHYDNVAAFTDFHPFGPWQWPTAKQFMDGPDVCGVSMDHDYIPL